MCMRWKSWANKSNGRARNGMKNIFRRGGLKTKICKSRTEKGETKKMRKWPK